MNERARNTDVTIYLKSGDTVTRTGVTEAEASRLEARAVDDPQVAGTVTITRPSGR